MVKRTAVILAAIAAVVILFFLAYNFIGTTNASGTVTLLMTDPPRYENISSINITFTRIELNRVGISDNEGWRALTGNSMTIDLLSIVNVTANLGSYKVPVGNYSQIRFMVSTATAAVNGQIVNLIIPSGAETGLKVHFQQPFELRADSPITIMIDISADNNGIHNGKLIPSMKATILP